MGHRNAIGFPRLPEMEGDANTSSCSGLLPISVTGGCMTDRVELVEAALDVYSEGLALLDGEERVVFWNRAAEAMTGYPGAEVIGRTLPESLAGLACGRDHEAFGRQHRNAQPGREALVHAQHKL